MEKKEKNPKYWEKRNCVHCNNEFEARKIQPNKLCSDECRKEWGKIDSNKQIRIDLSKKAMMDKYGITSNFQLDSVKDKIKQTSLERYGFDHYMKNENEKNRVISLSKKAIELNKDEIVDKRSKTKLEKYGDENYNNRDKFNATLNEKYGGFHLRLDEFKDKVKKTMMDRYGVDSSLKLQKTKDNMKAHILEKYGVASYVQSNHYKEKQGKIRLENIRNRMINLDLILLNDEIESKGVAQLKCSKCNSIFEHTQYFRSYIIKCPVCYPIVNNNSLNIFFEKIMNKYNIEFVKNNRTIIKPFELDYFLPQHNIAFELNGNYYHSEYGGGKLKGYHINKTNLCKNKNIKLIHIFEDEIIQKPEIVESKIMASIGKSPMVIPGRKTEVRDISNEDVSNFLNENHIQGSISSKIKIGLYYNDKLVFVSTFGKPRMDKDKNSYELYRSCSIINTSVIGGFGKCLKFFIKEYNPSRIISYADIRWSGIDIDNNIYKKNNFDFVSKTPPNYWYVYKKNYQNRLHRYQFRKNVLVKEGFDINKTESEIMFENGYDKIWDCGSLKFELKLNQSNSNQPTGASFEDI
jgi:hypothetical protein